MPPKYLSPAFLGEFCATLAAGENGPLNNPEGLPFLESVPSQPTPTASPGSVPPGKDSESRLGLSPSGEYRAERRAEARAQLEVDVSLHTDSRYFAGFTENLCSTGAFVATHLVEKVGTLVRVTLHLGEGTVGAVGEVRWTRSASESGNQPPGMGLRFVAIEPGGDLLLRALLARHG